MVSPWDPSSIEAMRAAESAVGRVAGVGRFFGAMLVMWVAGVVAAKCGVGDAHVHLATSVAIAALATVGALSARAEIGALLRRTGGVRGIVAVPAALAVLLVVLGIYFHLLRRFGARFESPSAVDLGAGWPLWTPFVLSALAPGIFEELAFRGYVMARLDRLLTPLETLLVQAALFAVLHLGVFIFPSHFLIGLVLGIVRRRTGSLYPGMVVHGLWNAFVIWSDLTGLGFP